ncbi:hypothetical protein GCM10022409_18970 [Hymenobacter glaciei]|uniref:DUF3575 domain-containing protein n=1 Tax=Hymenobacter glaciei TaxID=877209 RepID=A0ABP7U263_9BACT
MRTSSSFRTFLLMASLGTALTARAQTAPVPANATAPAAPAAVAPEFQRTTLLKFGTVLTNRTLSGIGQIVPVPLQLGIERRLSSKLAITGSLDALGIAGRVRPFANSEYGFRVFKLGAELGVRRYYRADAHPITRAYGGNYVALNARAEAFPYFGQLYPGGLGLSAQWGMQRRLGSHGLVDAFAGLGAETVPLLWSGLGVRLPVSATVELGVRLSLVR